MQEGAAQAHAVIEDDEIALEAEARRRRQHDDAVGRRDDDARRRPAAMSVPL